VTTLPDGNLLGFAAFGLANATLRGSTFDIVAGSFSWVSCCNLLFGEMGLVLSKSDLVRHGSAFFVRPLLLLARQINLNVVESKQNGQI
jgi:hypothetical protein